MLRAYNYNGFIKYWPSWVWLGWMQCTILRKHEIDFNWKLYKIAQIADRTLLLDELLIRTYNEQHIVTAWMVNKYVIRSNCWLFQSLTVCRLNINYYYVALSLPLPVANTKFVRFALILIFVILSKFMRTMYVLHKLTIYKIHLLQV